jgi:hypothetical protein
MKVYMAGSVEREGGIWHTYVPYLEITGHRAEVVGWDGAALAL